ncbi:acyltransferase family protein [Alteraurantiacibacter buctensis]|uniref:Acyltransferase family protein n=1 Tax=Alteraurantiacibacter buctensis TaxID=1503981 RepID=A0A844YWT3_9SPHN|nr:acyltransferase family protein [Alteraurantiacibacter buctensis]MXO71440.1 acyltransferase family protein [Alteraurantiacibacter buctensis]
MSIALDGIRGGAALVVLVGHAVQQELYTGPFGFDTSLQHNAVIVFFVLSGLVIANSAWCRPSSLPHYAIARFARVAPLVPVAIGLGLVAWAIGQIGQIDVIEQSRAYTTPSVAAVVLPAFFLSETSFGVGPLWNPPYWSLAVEVWFYVLFGAAFYLRGWRRMAVLAFAAAVAGITVLLLLPIWLLGVALARFGPGKTLPADTGFIAILSGLATILLSVKFETTLNMLMFSALNTTPAELGFAQLAASDFVFGLGVALCFLGMKPLVQSRAALLERFHPQISWLAECSFTLYLIHWPLLTLARGYGLSAGDNLLLFAAGLALIVALAGQVAKLTEHRRPQVRRWLADRWAARSASRQPQPVASPLRRLLRWGGIGVLGVYVFAGWLVAPTPLEPTVSPRTVGTLAQAPLASRIVIGDSRLTGIPSGQGVLFAGYPGATIGDMTRMARTLCLLSDAEIVIALGTNDAKPDMRRPAASLANLRRMVAACGPERVWVSEVWPAEQAKMPTGPDFDAATIAALNRGIRQLTAHGVGRLIPQPVLADHTSDGVHFNEATALRYGRILRTYGAT